MMNQYSAPYHGRTSSSKGCIAGIIAAIAVIITIWMLSSCAAPSRYRVPDDARHTAPCSASIEYNDRIP